MLFVIVMSCAIALTVGAVWMVGMPAWQRRRMVAGGNLAYLAVQVRS